MRLMVSALAMALASAAAPASAKDQPPPAAPSAGLAAQLSKEERAALGPLQAAVEASDWAKAATLLPAAQAAAQGGAAKYFLGQFEVNMGLGTTNEQMQNEGINLMIASGVAPAARLPALYTSQASIAHKTGNNQLLESALTKLVELSPNDPNNLLNLAQTEADLHKPQEAIPLIDKAIALSKAAGQKPDESWYKFELKQAYENKMAAESIRISQALLADYPTHTNWRDSLIVYRNLNQLDRSMSLDLLRLMRATRTMTSAQDWLVMGDTLNNLGLPGEAAAVLQEGGAQHAITLTVPPASALLHSATAKLAADKASLPRLETQAMAAATGRAALTLGDVYSGYGDYAKAATLYRAALSKGGVDASLANLHLGMALAQAGDRAGAQAALHAVTGPRAALASYWLAYSAAPPPAA